MKHVWHNSSPPPLHPSLPASYKIIFPHHCLASDFIYQNVSGNLFFTKFTNSKVFLKKKIEVFK